jgi:hypothetical protein
MASIDVIALALRFLSQTKDGSAAGMANLVGALPGVADLRAPFRAALRGGGSLVGEFHIPIGSLERIAGLVKRMMGGQLR